MRLFAALMARFASRLFARNVALLPSSLVTWARNSSLLSFGAAGDAGAGALVRVGAGVDRLDLAAPRGDGTTGFSTALALPLVVGAAGRTAVLRADGVDLADAAVFTARATVLSNRPLCGPLCAMLKLSLTPESTQPRGRA